MVGIGREGIELVTGEFSASPLQFLCQISPASAKLQIVVSNPSFKIRRDPMTCLLYTAIPVDSHTLQIKDNDRDTLHRYATKLIL